MICIQHDGSVTVKGGLLLLLGLFSNFLLDSVTHALQAADQLPGVFLLFYPLIVHPLHTQLAQVIITQVAGQPRREEDVQDEQNDEQQDDLTCSAEQGSVWPFLHSDSCLLESHK